MKNRENSFDIILSGVGGQGVLSVATIVSIAAMKEGYTLRQSEVHGMAQRGGAVLAHMRISKEFIESDLIPKGRADVILSMEPMESLRYLDYLSNEGFLITASEPFENIPDYPPIEKIFSLINSTPNSIILQSKTLAKEAGSLRSVNMVMVGALSSKLPIKEEHYIEAIREKFSSKGEKIIEANIKAFYLGRESSGGRG